MAVLAEKRSNLPYKKTRIGDNFLGIQYPKTQPPDDTTIPQAPSKSVPVRSSVHKSTKIRRKVNTTKPQLPELSRIVPHPRCLVQSPRTSQSDGH